MLCRALRHRFLVLFVVTIVILGVPVAAHATWFNDAVSLTPKSYSHRNPRIQGTNVIYQSQRGGHWGIFRYNLLTSAETTIKSDTYDYSEHAIWGQWVVWTRDDGVYACNIGHPESPWKVASYPDSAFGDSFNAYAPDVYDNKIVYWRSHPAGSFGIFLGYRGADQRNLPRRACNLRQLDCLHVSLMVWSPPTPSSVRTTSKPSKTSR